MTYTLYTRKDTGGFAVEAALAKAGARHTLIEIDTKAGAHCTPAFVALNPMRQIPALVMPDGSVVTESAAIVMHLADVFAGKGLAPQPGTAAHARFLRWMLFMATNIYEADLRYYYAERYTDDPRGSDGVKSAAARRMAHCFEIIAAALDPFVAGATFSIADAYLAMLAGWSPEPVPSAKIAAVRAAVLADPDYRPVCVRHGMVG